MRSNSSSEFHKVYMHAMRMGTSFMEMAFHLQSQELLENKFTGTMSRLLLWKIITKYHCTMNLFLMWSVRWRLDLLLMKIIVLGYSIYCLVIFAKQYQIYQTLMYQRISCLVLISTSTICLFSAMFTTEYRMWVRKWKECTSKVPYKMIDAFRLCDRISYPNIYLLLQITLTIPITSCESECSFSQLKLLKTPIQSTMTATILSSL